MAAQNIDGTLLGTGVFNTKVPGYEDAADIQAALRLFLYGSTSFDPTAENAMENLPNPSIARYLKIMQDEIDLLEEAGLGSSYGSEPTDPSAGYIWMPSDATATVPLVQAAIYQNSAPVSNLVDGLLWVDKNSSPLAMYVYDLATTTWKEIGA
jgi:hypothetical protein